MEKYIKELWEDCEIMMFGSFVTGLALPDSPLDIVVLTKEQLNVKNAIKKLAKHLIEQDALAENEETMCGGVVFLKVIEKQRNIGVNIFFNYQGACKSTEITMLVLEGYPHLKWLLLPLKAYLRERKLNSNKEGKLGSFPLMIMLMSYLQYQAKLTNWKLKDMSLGELLIEFFEFFGCKFNHELLGLSVIGKGGFYRRESGSKGISIENPLNPTVDLGDSVRCYNDVVKSLQYGYDLLKYNAGALTELIYSYPDRKHK